MRGVLYLNDNGSPNDKQNQADENRPQEKAFRRPDPFLLLHLTIYVLLAVGYIGLRFDWRWLPNDAATLTEISQNTYQEGTIAPNEGSYYLGYAYPVLNAFLAQVGSLTVRALQVYIQPFLIALLVPGAYVAFRALLRNGSVAALASLLLFLQPDFLFEAVRSSHAKVTWLLAFAILYVLVRSFEVGGRMLALVRWVLVFYLLAFGLIASNSFFASSYVFGLSFSFLGGWMLVHWRRQTESPEDRLRRLLYVSLACSVLLFLFLFYLYPPALQMAGTLNSTLDRISGFLLDVETGTNPYQYIQAAWLNEGLYLALSSLSWLVLVLSFANWLYKARLLFWQRQALPPGQLLLWLLYSAFALLLALGVVLDLAGTLSANLQVRLFPHLMIMAVPLAAELISHIARAILSRELMVKRVSIALLALLGIFFSAASLLKATNEPLLNNHWLFYLPEERAAVEWAGPHLGGPRVWVGLDDRLRALLTAYGDWQAHGLKEYTGRQAVERYDLLLSQAMEAQAVRLGAFLPNAQGWQKVYDAGDAALYHARPQTPYQR